MRAENWLPGKWRGAGAQPGQSLSAIVVLLVVLLLVLRAWELVRVHAENSLWTDEIVSVEMISGRGLATSLSEYSLPNNHVLFNAINAVLPGSGSFDPLRARIVSFVAVGFGLLIGVIALARRRAWLLVLAFALAYLGDDRLLSVHLAARGYSILALAAVLVSVLICRIFETAEAADEGADNSPPLSITLALAATVALGALTVPTFLFFGGSVLLALFLRHPCRRYFFAGLSVFVLVVGFFSWLYIFNHGLDKAPAGFFEGEFHELTAALAPVQLFALEGWPEALRFAVVLFVIAAPWLAPPGSARRESLWCLWWGVVGSLTICLIMKRPLMHTVAHLMIPGGVMVGLGLESLAAKWSERWRHAPLVIGSVIVLLVTVSALRPRDPLTLWPVESWREIAATIDTLSGGNDSSLRVWAPYRGQQLGIYLPERAQLDSAFDADAFATGEQVIVASQFNKYPDEKVAGEVVAAAAVRLSVRQKSHSFQQIAWNPSAGRRAEILSCGPKPGTSSGKTFSMKLRLPAGAEDDALLYFFSDDPIMSKAPTVRAAKPGGGTRSLTVEAIGCMWAVYLRGDIDLSEPVDVVYYSGKAGDFPPGFVAWIGGPIPDSHVRRLIY